ncbi:hypothetical protein HZS61_005024 [Fusarium oxysporum f. sp. conglutinans]|uniref:HTH CENPB-type domain-containing protein n=1 Tax=Fusarium oxysporum f. sp. conglutinans TaxID=100902 RepID=A0A8H6LDF7_FUSOX|nr:hypothetical protein HZS61_005024 [Fusarium oxysporum f. sp. conglutinans]KAG6978934.1 hypothetical protein FocnCong_v010945 [Fusarium oxysporum f. sp. conglutinans]
MPEYTEQDLQNAIVDVRNGVAVRTAATRHGVPRGTLRARLNGAQPQRTAHGDQQRLTANQEEHLKQWILRQEALGYAPTHAQVRAIASSVLKQQGDHKPLGRKWSSHFVERHLAVKTKLGRRTDWKRINAATPDNIKHLFNLYETVSWIPPRRKAPCARPKLIQRCFNQEQMPPLQTASKKETADAFLRWVQSLDPLTLVIYSDGSLSSQGAASYGFTIHQGNFPVLDGSGRLGPAEVFDAEATGALQGLKAALNLQESVSRNLIICLDNLAAATCLRGTPSDSSQDVFLEFQALAALHGATQARWVPGHTDIPGNEQADKLAKAASSAPEPGQAQPTLAYLRRIARQKPKEAFETWWSTSAPEQYKRLNLKATTGCPPELSLPRAALHHLLAARSLHGDFAAYHERFDHVDARLVCSCGRRKAPDHIFYCRKIPPRHRMRLAPSPNAAVNLAIGKDFTKYIDLSKASAFFGNICPRY